MAGDTRETRSCDLRPGGGRLQDVDSEIAICGYVCMCVLYVR